MNNTKTAINGNVIRVMCTNGKKYDLTFKNTDTIAKDLMVALKQNGLTNIVNPIVAIDPDGTEHPIYVDTKVMHNNGIYVLDTKSMKEAAQFIHDNNGTVDEEVKDIHDIQTEVAMAATGKDEETKKKAKTIILDLQTLAEKAQEQGLLLWDAIKDILAWIWKRVCTIVVGTLRFTKETVHTVWHSIFDILDSLSENVIKPLR